MPSITLSPERVEALDFETAQAFEAFQRAVSSRDNLEAHWSRGMFDALVNSLVQASRGSIMGWRRGTKKADLFDRYILQYALGNGSSLELTRATTQGYKESPTDITEESLRQSIDSRQGRYLDLDNKAASLARAGNFDAIVRTLKYVRDNIR